MKLLILSDLHFEFHADEGRSFSQSFKNADYDVAIIAGDIADYNGLDTAISLLANNFKQIIYTPGNHEFYGGSIPKTWEKINKLSNKYSNFHPLNNSTFKINKQRFIGCTLWFRNKIDNFLYTQYMNDFFQVENLKNVVYEENEKSIKFLEENMKKGDVVITHHLPSEKCVVPKYKGNPLNRFFVCEMDELIEERKPKTWINGHSHESCDFNIGPTRIICNPFGYVGVELNQNFIDELIIDV